MPTTRNRIMITPSDEALALVNELNALTGTPKAAIVSELLDQVAPVIKSHIQAVRYASEGRVEEAQKIINRFAAETIGQLSQAQLELDTAVTDARTVKGKRAKKGGIRGRTP